MRELHNETFMNLRSLLRLAELLGYSTSYPLLLSLHPSIVARYMLFGLSQKNFSGNVIKELHNETFMNLRSLLRLNLGSNRLQRLPKDIFKNLSTLQEL
ncbi:unnamed protein product [Porites evermanni]|uniref:Uncharacterized protein n=1 Tax=Porites evermanni TaxID=104178 RepID=A0ABN8LXW0_9CNID|nr:unnamed protein product [Porites evermanni]